MFARIALNITILVILAAALAPLPARAGNYNGYVEYRYADYDVDAGDDGEFHGSSFTQQYGLIWRDQQRLAGGRLGAYKLALGAEFNALNTETDGEDRYGDKVDEDIDLDSFKIYYEGELVLAPAKMPFSLKLYSRDLHRSTFNYDDNEDEASAFEQRNSPIMASRLAYDLVNGQRVESGFSLIVDATKFRHSPALWASLAEWPRLLVDYSEVLVKNTEGISEEHYRDRNTAFVALNFRKNWLHYRAYEHKDYIDSLDDTMDEDILIGTVDPGLRRQWIQMNNWLQISTDANLSRNTEKIDRASADTETWAFNLFSIARRQKWEASNFNRFSRERQESGRGEYLRRTMEIPFYASGSTSPDNSWRAQFVNYFTDRDENLYDWQGREEEKHSGLRFAIDLNKRRVVQFTPEIAAEIAENQNGSGFGLEAGATWQTNPGLPRTNSWLVRWFASYIDSSSRGNIDRFYDDEYDWSLEEEDEAPDTDYFETRVQASYQRPLAPSWQGGIEQFLLYGNGTIDSPLVRAVRVQGESRLLYSDAAEATPQTREGTVIRSTTTLFADQVRGTLKNRYELILDVLHRSEDPADESGEVLALRHKLTYTRQSMLAEMANMVAYGEDLEGTEMVNFEYLSDRTGDGESLDWAVNSTGLLQYEPLRKFSAAARYGVHVNGTGLWTVAAEQSARYSFYKTNGIMREWLRLTQGLVFESIEGEDDGDNAKAIVFKLGGLWSPRHAYSLGGGLEYQYFLPYNYGQLLTKVTAGVNFPLFELNVSYSYGLRDAFDDDDSPSGNLDQRTESLLEVNLKKTI